MFQNYPDVITTEQVAEMIGVCKSTIYNLLKTQRLRHVRVGRKYVIPKQAVIDFVIGSSEQRYAG